jgi:hypothetical protein
VVADGDTPTVMPEAEDEEGQTISWTFTDGEVLKFRLKSWPASDTGTAVLNGGLADASLIIASYVAGGVTGNAAYAALKLGLRFLRQRLAWGTDGDKQRYVAQIAQLAVTATLTEPVDVKVIRCDRQRDHWAAVVLAEGKTFRVQIPLDDPRPTAISVDVS